MIRYCDNQHTYNSLADRVQNPETNIFFGKKVRFDRFHTKDILSSFTHHRVRMEIGSSCTRHLLSQYYYNFALPLFTQILMIFGTDQESRPYFSLKVDQEQTEEDG